MTLQSDKQGYHGHRIVCKRDTSTPRPLVRVGSDGGGIDPAVRTRKNAR